MNRPTKFGGTAVIVTVRGGLVSSVHSTDPDLKVWVLDWDAVAVGEWDESDGQKLEREANQMHLVWDGQ